MCIKKDICIEIRKARIEFYAYAQISIDLLDIFFFVVSIFDFDSYIFTFIMYAFVGKCEGYTQIKVSVNNFFYLYFYLPCVCVAFPHCNPLRCLRPTWTTMWYDCDWNSKWMWHIRPIATTTRTTSTTRCCCRPDWCPDRCW